MWANDFICDFIKSLERIIDPDWVLYKSEYLIFLCFGLNNEHPLSFVYVTEGGVNVKTDEFFYVEILPLLWRLWCSLLYYILKYLLGTDASDISSMSTLSGNPSFYPKYLLVEILSLFFV